jgi:hypothetical protein
MRSTRHLLENCNWVEEFVHSGASTKPAVSSSTTPILRTRPVESKHELASDPSWITVLLLGDDAPAACAYAWRFSCTGSPLGVVNLFNKQGLNLIAVTVDEAKDLILESGVAAILSAPSAMASVADSIFSRFSPLQPAVFAGEAGTTA